MCISDWSSDVCSSDLGAEPPHEFLELGHMLDEMRLFKSRDELKLMRKAAKVTVLAHQDAMSAERPGVHEYELQAQIECVFRAHDGDADGKRKRLKSSHYCGSRKPSSA